MWTQNRLHSSIVKVQAGTPEGDPTLSRGGLARTVKYIPGPHSGQGGDQFRFLGSDLYRLDGRFSVDPQLTKVLAPGWECPPGGGRPICRPGAAAPSQCRWQAGVLGKRPPSGHQGCGLTAPSARHRWCRPGHMPRRQRVRSSSSRGDPPLPVRRAAWLPPPPGLRRAGPGCGVAQVGS